jgi:hypothetical protein
MKHPSFLSHLLALLLIAAGTTGTATAGLVFAQLGSEDSASNGSSESDSDKDFQLFDDVTLTTAATIRSVKWWGTYGPFDKTPVAPFSFQLIFYGDSGGLPNYSNVLSSTTVHFATLSPSVEIIPAFSASFTDTNYYEFRADITPTAIPANTKVWFSVFANTANDPGDSFLQRLDDLGNAVRRTNDTGLIIAQVSRQLFELHNTPLRPVTTIYADDFSSAGNLHGTVPDARPGVETWAASTDWQANGTTTSVGSTSEDDSAFLPFTPVAGKIYTLSANLTQPTGGTTTAWAAIGFSASNGTGAFAASPNNPSPWMALRKDFKVRTYAGPGASDNVVEPNEYDKRRILRIVLNTSSTQWTAEWFVGLRSVRKVTFATTPVINFVGLAREDGVAADFDSFRLTEVDAAEIPPRIVSFSRIGGNLWELELLGNPGMPFQFRSSTNLIFSPGNLVQNLTQGTPGDSGTISGPNQSIVTTDPNGNARVRLFLSGNASDFVRGESLP